MQFKELSLPGVFRIDLDRIQDERGFFARIFCQNELAEHSLNARIVQCNNTLTRQIGTIRGMHFQRPPKAETKIVRCIRGAIFDVAVDLRAESDTYGQWCSIELNDQDRSMIYIPQGFAHGFQTLATDTELLYFHSEFYSQLDEGGLDPLDPAVAIAWPLPIQTMSARDRQQPLLTDLKAIEL